MHPRSAHTALPGSPSTSITQIDSSVNTAYIADNQAYIPDYGDRHHNGERISSAFAESAVNQLVGRRMVKRQQMHWTKRGTHLLLQVRAQVMNGDLRGTFRRRYPGMKVGSEDPIRRAA